MSREKKKFRIGQFVGVTYNDGKFIDYGTVTAIKTKNGQYLYGIAFHMSPDEVSIDFSWYPDKYLIGGYHRNERNRLLHMRYIAKVPTRVRNDSDDVLDWLFD